MTTTLYALYDGEVLHPEGPIPASPNTRVRLVVETPEPPAANSGSFLNTARSLNLQGPADWSERFHDANHPAPDAVG